MFDLQAAGGTQQPRPSQAETALPAVPLGGAAEVTGLGVEQRRRERAIRAQLAQLVEGLAAQAARQGAVLLLAKG